MKLCDERCLKVPSRDCLDFSFCIDNLKEISIHVRVIYFPHSHIKFIHEDGIPIASCSAFIFDSTSLEHLQH